MTTPRITVVQAPALVDLALYQGDDFFMDVILTDALGAPIDLTGYTPLSQIRQTPPSDVVAAPIGCVRAANVIHMHLLAADSAALDLLTYAWDVQITSASGIITTVAYGAVAMTQEVTR